MMSTVLMVNVAELSVMLDCTNVSLLGGSFHLKMIRFVCVFDYHHLYAAVHFF